MFSENCFICNTKLKFLDKEALSDLYKGLIYYECPKECCIITYFNNEIYRSRYFFSNIKYPELKDAFEIIYKNNQCNLLIIGEDDYNYFNDNAEEIFRSFLKDKSLKKLFLIQ